MNLPDLLILSLGTWRLAYFITREDAPFQAMAKTRARLPLGGLMACIYCTSLWCAAGLYVLMQTPALWIVYILAISGAALMLAKYTGMDYQT